VARPKKTTVDAQWNQRLKLVEEYAVLDAQIQSVKPYILRHDKLRKLILDWYPDVPAEEEIRVPGRTSDIVISSRDKIRSVTAKGKRALLKLWGAERFLARSVVLLKSLPNPEDDEGLYTVSALTGPRHLYVMAKVKSAAESAVS
jgi:hypothetical protein